MKWRKIQLLSIGLLFSLGLQAQVLDFIDIHLTIREKVGNEMKVLPNAKLELSDQGTVTTNEMGAYKYTYPVRNEVDPKISIALVSNEHKMLKPLDGSVVVDPTREEMFIEFVVVNMEEESAAFRKKISDLEARMNQLRQKNEMTEQQLNQLNATLVDTIMYYESMRVSMERQIDGLQDLTDDQQTMINQQRRRIDSLEQQVSVLSQELTLALEKKYLRQNQYFKDISANFAKYIRSVNDVTEHLGFIKTYFSSGDFRSLDRDLRLYEEAFVAISDAHQDHIAGVNRYWANPGMTKELEEIFELLLNGIHLNSVRPTLNGVIDQVQKQKPGKAQKMADAAAEDIAINIRSLEQRINRILIKLRNT